MIETLKDRKEFLEERYRRLKKEPPDYVISFLLHSILNSFINKELRQARDHGLHYLVLMGVHACILTINKYIFCKGGKSAFKEYLQLFIDGFREDLKFSRYYNWLYERRNALAHQWLSVVGHEFGFDSSMKEGIVKKDSIVLLNTSIYFDQFKSAFTRKLETKKCIWDVVNEMTSMERKKAKEKIIDAYTNFPGRDS